jgi:hypothetical protein
VHPFLQEFKSIVENQTIFVLGGGPSVKSLDLSLLKDRHVIAINASAYDVVEPTALYWADDYWAEENANMLESHPCKYKFSSRRYGKAEFGKYGEFILRLVGGNGYASNPEQIKGNNSGAHVINFCINMGAKRIILLGFDMKYVNNKSHYHDRYTKPVIYDTYKEVFIPSINALYAATASMNLDIINCSMDSELHCYKKVPFEEVIASESK